MSDNWNVSNWYWMIFCYDHISFLSPSASLSNYAHPIFLLIEIAKLNKQKWFIAEDRFMNKKKTEIVQSKDRTNETYMDYILNFFYETLNIYSAIYGELFQTQLSLCLYSTLQNYWGNIYQRGRRTFHLPLNHSHEHIREGGWGGDISPAP